MRFPVFARRSNPAVDSPILRKSRVYVEGEVCAARADWVDFEDHSKGIICREMLYFGPPREEEPLDISKIPLPAAELPGIHFEEPLSAKIARLVTNVAMLRRLKDFPHSTTELNDSLPGARQAEISDDLGELSSDGVSA